VIPALARWAGVLLSVAGWFVWSASAEDAGHFVMTGADLVAQYPYVIPLQLGRTGDWVKGDNLRVLSVRGDRPRLELGGTYLVRGVYGLAGAMEATLSLNITSPAGYMSNHQPFQSYRIEQGYGDFALVETMTVPGAYHVSFYYPWHGGRSDSHGAIYFADLKASSSPPPAQTVPRRGGLPFDAPIVPVRPLPPRLRGAKVEWARLRTEGLYWNRHAADDAPMLKFMEDKVGFAPGRVWSAADARDLEQLCTYPFLFAESIAPLAPDERHNLGEYLKRGGFIFIDACINAAVNPDLGHFLADQTTVLRAELPDLQIRELTPQDGIYSDYFQVDRAPPSGDPGYVAPLRALISGGRTVGILSISGIQCGIAGFGERTARLDCEEMAANIYIYAMTR
jgi:Domain of unknown function (DUF4159)